MRYKQFDELPVWNTAIDFMVRLLDMTATGALSTCAGLKNQLERAGVSISNNIAEGFDRGTHEELVTFLYYAKGSLSETKSMLLLLSRTPMEPRFASYLEELLPMTDSIGRQLGGWLESLKDGSSRGPRFDNTATRGQKEMTRRGKAFREELERMVEESRNKPIPSREPGLEPDPNRSPDRES